MKRLMNASLLVFGALLVTGSASAADAKRYGPGVTDSEIKIGQTIAYSGPLSGYATQGKLEAAYYQMINSKGGVNGRKINLISLDDGYSPPKTVEQTRKLVEQDEILASVGSLGTPTNMAIYKYMNLKKVPHILILSGDPKWTKPQDHPWTTPFFTSNDMESRIYAKYLLQIKPDAKIAILYQNDDFGKGSVRGFKEGLGDKAASMIVKELSYEVSDPTIESQIVTLRSTQADTFLDFSTPKFAAQAIRKVHQLGWQPLHIVPNVTSSISTVLVPAGPENAVGLITAVALKMPGDPTWAADKGMQEYLQFLKDWYPAGDPADPNNVVAYNSAQLAVHILEACGDDLTRENVLKQATSLNEVGLPLLLPGITITVSPDDYRPFRKLRLSRFDGKRWVEFGDLISASDVEAQR
jgi:ABC-type branched-subunit amino acid transport system substrate-binding protein